MLSLSHEKISSFRGDVIPLHIGFDGERHAELASADIVWSVSGDAVHIRAFSGEDAKSFNNGVLVVLDKVGTASVTAEYEGEKYVCLVEVREMKHAEADEDFEYYFGDMHAHTARTHDHEKFAARESEMQSEYIEFMKNDGLLDLGIISDHACVLNDTDFFRGFTEVEKASEGRPVILPGAESEIFYVKADRLGIPHRLSGEIVTLNSDGYANANAWEHFEEILGKSPMGFGIFAHPIVSGFSTKGMWNFDFKRRNSEMMLNFMRGVELGSGEDENENLIYEYAYSDALDAGFRVSPTQSSDAHGPVWGYNLITGKTVILAKERSAEAFIDAFRSNRFYASESGNIKLRYTVNGKVAPCDLSLCDKYSFHVEISLFKEKEGTRPVEFSVISDYGDTVYTEKDVKCGSFDFEISSDSARYFYLRILDENGKRTWSMPVWTGRSFDALDETEYELVESKNFSATELVGGVDASLAINGNPYDLFEAGSSKASVLIDMKEEKEVRAIGFYQRIVERVSKKIVPVWNATDYIPGFVFRYEVYMGNDEASLEKVKVGLLRAFGSEEMITFEPQTARYIRFDVVETVGSYCGLKKYADKNATIGNISIFK